MSGWQNGIPNGPVPGQQPPWDVETETPVLRTPPPPRSSSDIDPIPLPDKRGKGMYVAAGVCGVVVVLMLTAIVMAVTEGGGPTAAGPTSSPIPGGAAGASDDTPSTPASRGGRTGSGAPVIALQDSIGTYKRWTGPLADKAIETEKRTLTKEHPDSADSIAAAQFAVYRRGTTPLLVIAQSAAANPQVAQLLGDQGPAKAADSMLGTPGKAFLAGPKGGALRCAQKMERTGLAIRCAWADKTMLVLLEAPHVTEASLAHLTLTLRNDTES